MTSLLIVEDEKHIRLGIRAMAERSPVDIGTILEARNGEEALEILRGQPVDIMLTDIRMPKMDGITLVRESRGLPVPPLTAVISGYDDFTYAVDMLRQGVREYLLKPVERGRVFEVLEKLEAELQARRERERNEANIGRQLLKLTLQDENVPRSVTDEVAARYGALLREPYAVICARETDGKDAAALSVTDAEGQEIVIARENDVSLLTDGWLRGRCAGISGVHTGADELRAAYREAVTSRLKAFSTGKGERYSEPGGEPRAAGGSVNEAETRKQSDIIVQLLGAANGDGAKKALRQLLAALQKEQPEGFAAAIEYLIQKINDAYRAVLPEDGTTEQFLKPFIYESLREYRDAFCEWIDGFCDRLTGEFNNYQSKQKIIQAVGYINDNYGKEWLNMAMVSNHVSMNYSLFSHLFKQYTGSNFVNYLRGLRIDASKRLLVSTDMKIHEISKRAGFQNVKNFMKLFKAVCGVSPGEYRKNARLGKE